MHPPRGRHDAGQEGIGDRCRNKRAVKKSAFASAYTSVTASLCTPCTPRQGTNRRMLVGPAPDVGPRRKGDHSATACWIPRANSAAIGEVRHCHESRVSVFQRQAPGGETPSEREARDNGEYESHGGRPRSEQRMSMLESSCSRGIIVVGHSVATWKALSIGRWVERKGAPGAFALGWHRRHARDW